MILVRSRPIARVLRAAAVFAAAGALCFAPSRGIAAEPAARGALADPVISWIPAGPPESFRYRVELAGINPEFLARARAEKWADWGRVLRVYVMQGTDLVPGMTGTYHLEGASIQFDPSFPLTPGVTYRAAVSQPRSAEPAVTGERFPNGIFFGSVSTDPFTVPSRAARPPTTVTQVYPTADVLPENLLKFYVHFSAAMNGGNIYSHVHLLDENGKEVASPFVEFAEELWSPDMTRVTFLISPGRIKRGLALLEEVGPALAIGKMHTLVIDRDWRDGHGQPLRETFRKTFRVAEADRTQPDPKKWKLTAPAAGSRAPFTIEFEGPMDQALADRLLDVVDASGRIVAGKVALTENERRWTLTPDAAWSAGSYKVVANALVEDLAGNNLAKLFDVDVFENVEKAVVDKTVSIPFNVR